jgi:Flp pilus assembly protein TadD/capsular polysaccharide biosynthesis protein
MEPVDPAKLAELRRQARAREDSNDFAGLEALYRTVVGLIPSDSGARTDLGTSLFKQGRAEEALTEYLRAVEIDPGNAGAHFGASIALTRLGRLEEAILAVRSAIQTKASEAQYFSQLGHLLARVGQRKEAIDSLERVLRFEPENVGVHRIIRDLFIEEGLLDAATDHARHAAELEPENVSHWIALAHTLGRSNRVVEAIAALESATASQPQDVKLREELLYFHARADNLDEAISYARQAHAMNPSNAHVLYALSCALAQAGKFADAEAAIDQALTIDVQQPAFLEQKKKLGAIKAGHEFALVPSRSLAISSEDIVESTEVFMPRCLTYTNFMDLNPEFARHNLESVYVDRWRRLPPITLCRLDASVRLFVPSDEDFILLSSDRVASEQVRPNWSSQDLTDAVKKFTREERIDGPVVLIARWGIRTWGHWLGELLPKLVSVESYYPGRFRYVLPDILVREAGHRNWLQSLEYYGIDRDRLVLVSQGVSYTAPEMHVVTPVWSTDGPRVFHPKVADLMRKWTPGHPPARTGPQKVALRRKASRTRNVENIGEVEELLVRRGWTVLDIEQLEFSQQVALFRDARSIISVLGSGLTGLVYAPRGIKIITLAPSHWGDSFFYALMQERAASLVDIRGTSLATDQNDSEQVRKASFMVPLAELETGLTLLDLTEIIPSKRQIRPPRMRGATSNTSVVWPRSPWGGLAPLTASDSSDLQRGVAEAPVVVSVQHEAAKIGDSLNIVPFILALALQYGRSICVRGQFSRALRPLVAHLPISFEEIDTSGPRIEYTADVKKSWEYAGPRGMHMLQGYFALAGMAYPDLPISLPLDSEPTPFAPGVVISPFCAQREDNDRHVRVWFVDRWNAVIDFLLSREPTPRIYVVGGPEDDVGPFLRDGVIPVIGYSFTQVLDLMQRAQLCITIDTGTSHLAHFGRVSRHVLLYPAVNYFNIHVNPRARVIHAWPKEITAEQVIAACIKSMN